MVFSVTPSKPTTSPKAWKHTQISSVLNKSSSSTIIFFLFSVSTPSSSCPVVLPYVTMTLRELAILKVSSSPPSSQKALIPSHHFTKTALAKVTKHLCDAESNNTSVLILVVLAATFDTSAYSFLPEILPRTISEFYCLLATFSWSLLWVLAELSSALNPGPFLSLL